MLRRRSKSSEPEPTLGDRVLASGCRRIAVLGLHPRAGTRTVLAALVHEFARRDQPCALASFPRLHVDEVMVPEPVTRLPLPAGAVVARAEDGALGEGTTVQQIEQTRYEADGSPVGIFRVVGAGELELSGAEEAPEFGALLERMADVCGGPVLADGGWTRRAFSAPGVTDGIVLCVGAGYSATPERSAAALRYLVEVYGAAGCPSAARAAWPDARAQDRALVLDRKGGRLASLHPDLEGAAAELERHAERAGTVVLPHGLRDTLLAPLVRQDWRCTLVVRDATRVHASPVYLKAWQKSGGRLQVVQPATVIAATTNPVNFTGADADAQVFHAAVRDALGELPVHDVVLEAPDDRKGGWRFWRTQ